MAAWVYTGMTMSQSTPKLKPAEPIKGWLTVYLVALGFVTLRAAVLTLASLVIHAHPAAYNVTSFPLWQLLVYVITNGVIIAYAGLLYVLMFQKKRSAITHNMIFNVMVVLLFFGWCSLGLMTVVSTLVDATFSFVMLVYMVTSKQVIRTFTR